MLPAKQMPADVYRNRYEADIIPKLEEYVTQQLKENTFDVEANIALLKLYQLFPERSSTEGIQKVLLKALMNLKDNAFTCAMYLVPQKYHENTSIGNLIQLSNLLELAQYKEFWHKTTELQDITVVANGFTPSIRDFIFDVLSITYRTIDTPFLSEALHLQQESELKSYLQLKGLKVESGFVSFPVNDFTQMRPKVAPQNIQFEQIAKIF
eukprot:TRINITY_DN7233_c2_g1_i1.p3 TRINITY_DN7233_c2_g1~~TRINITY_DN7233_c2_g1_i1.p3  ORF type:complete len:210 (+),score=52.51 TRINITY_DN7233_c2_g1_i1:908-1537(+)